jgi:hypothetical protein
VLICWSELPKELASWEDYESLKQKFPSTPSWGQAASKGEGSVSTDAPIAAAVPDAAIEKRPTRTWVGARKSQQAKKPNVRIAGPKWA